MIIWLTGQPASGKTTLANSIIMRLSKENPELKISVQQFQLLDF